MSRKIEPIHVSQNMHDAAEAARKNGASLPPTEPYAKIPQTYGKYGKDGLHVFTSDGQDRTQAMLEHATRVQLYGQVMNDVSLQATLDFSELVTDQMNAREAGCLTMPRLALLSGTSIEAVATAMPKVRLHHPPHPTLQ